MGNTCKGQETEIPTQAMFPPLNINNLFYKSPVLSIRMGQVQKLRSSNLYQPNRSLFILPIKQTEQLCKIECPVITSYSDNLSLNVPLLSGIETVRLKAHDSPILDLHEIQTDRQIMHKFVVKGISNQEQYYTVKVYPFNNYHDDVFKNGLYEAYLYRTIQGFTKSTILRDFFIIEKGMPQALVFVYGPFLCTLEDIILYRKQHNVPYSVDEQLYIADQILSKYKILHQNNIVHRDIRPSKIYLGDSSSAIRTPYASTAGYEFLNLQSARKMLASQVQIYKLGQDSSLFMSTRGVPLYCQPNVTDLHLRKQAAGIYDPWSNDRVQLAKTLAMIVTLNVNTQQIDYHSVRVKNKIIHNLIKDLQNISLLIPNITTDFHNKYGSKLKYSKGILESDQNIYATNLPNLIRSANQQRIQDATTQVLFYLHQRELLTERVDRMMSENYKSNQFSNNVAILDRVGRYYEGMGVTNNDYYKEQMNLLMQMSQDYRQRRFRNDEIMKQAGHLYTQKFNGKINNPSLHLDYKIESAYEALGKGDLSTADKIINEAFLEGGSNNIPIDTQFKLIESGGVIQSLIRGPDAGNFYLQKGLDLSNNRQNFVTEVQMLDSQSNFQYLIGKNILIKINLNRGAMSQDQQIQQLSRCQSFLSQARQTKSNIPMKNPVSLANIYEALGDLSMMKEDDKAASSYYQRANNLYGSSEVQIANQQKIRMLQKLYGHYQQHSDNYAEQERVRVMIDNLKKSSEIKRSTDRNDRSHFKRIRTLKLEYKNKLDGGGNNIIQQAAQFEEEDPSKHLFFAHSQNQQHIPSPVQQNYNGLQVNQPPMIDQNMDHSYVQPYRSNPQMNPSSSQVSQGKHNMRDPQQIQRDLSNSQHSHFNPQSLLNRQLQTSIKFNQPHLSNPSLQNSFQHKQIPSSGSYLNNAYQSYHEHSNPNI